MSEGKLLPVANRTESFWLTERDPELKAARTTPDLPSSADVVIIGSGLTGAMMGYHIMKKAQKEGKQLKVVMLEADECCGSATARNGGHCKPVTFIGYRSEAKKHGAAVANHLLTFEEAALGLYADVVRKEDIDCDLHVTRAIDVFYRKEDAQSAKLDLEARAAAFPDATRAGDIRLVEDPKVLEQMAGVTGTAMGASYPAGHLWPYKLATSLIRIAIREGMSIQTYTPALSMEAAGAKWTVITARGKIAAGKVIVATNAYTSSVLPEFKPLIIPVRGAACSITPPPSHSAAGIPGPFRYSYGFRHAQGQIDYMIPRQGRGRVPGVGDTSLILGGAKGVYLGHLDRWYNNKHDNEIIPGTKEYFEGYMSDHFAGWRKGEGSVDHVWSGVLGYSSDLLPLVGEHPDRPGVYVIAGFTGHGMPRIPGCSDALSTLVLSDSQSAQKTFETALPKPYWLTRERLESKTNAIKAAMGQGEGVSAARETNDEVNMLAQAVKAKL